MTGNKALKVWIYKAVKTERFLYLAYSWNYGTEIHNLIGQPYTKSYRESEAQRYIREALLVNPYIKDVTDFEINFEKDTLNVSFKAQTVYGEVIVDVY